MKKQVLTLGICLAFLSFTRPADAQTLASAQASSSATQVEEKQPAETKTTETSTFAIKASRPPSGFEQGDILISAGISIGTIGYGGYVGSGSGFLPVFASGEYSINDLFAVGPYLGFYSRSYDYNSGYSYKWSSFSFGGKFTFHATGLLNKAFDSSMDEEKIDLYATAYAGIRTYSYSGDYGTTYANTSDFRSGVTAGGRYFFTPMFGVFAEVGYGVFGALNTGVSFKF